jgi:ribosomal protein S27AE
VATTNAEMLSWFEDDELRVCPACGETTVFPVDVLESRAVCSNCGIVEAPAAAT